jgi:uncharacterized protein (DUF2141 family)
MPSQKVVISSNPSVIITVKGIQNHKGHILIAVYDNPSAFESNTPKQAIAKVSLLITGTTASAEFNLKAGTYAIQVLHDENNNKILDKNWLGIPTEAIGLSHGLKSKFRKPTFAECSFQLRQHRQHIDITLEKF